MNKNTRYLVLNMEPVCVIGGLGQLLFLCKSGQRTLRSCWDIGGCCVLSWQFDAHINANFI